VIEKDGREGGRGGGRGGRRRHLLLDRVVGGQVGGGEGEEERLFVVREKKGPMKYFATLSKGLIRANVDHTR